MAEIVSPLKLVTYQSFGTIRATCGRGTLTGCCRYDVLRRNYLARFFAAFLCLDTDLMLAARTTAKPLVTIRRGGLASFLPAPS